MKWSDINYDAWEESWAAWIGQGKIHKEQVARFLADDPQITVAELARRIGCSDTTASKWKKRVEQERMSA